MPLGLTRHQGRFSFKSHESLDVLNTGKVENLHAHVNRNLQHANPNLHVL